MCRKPVLVVRPQPKGHDKPLAFDLRLIPIIAPGTIPLQKLAPDRNCIRPSVSEAAAPQDQLRQELPPTPLYNTALLQVCRRSVQPCLCTEREPVSCCQIYIRASCELRLGEGKVHVGHSMCCQRGAGA